ncbi:MULTISPECIES: hypothetical protein [Bacillus amyloliquefaciens group]|uniref:hypothetical protein n=1 Tax=Bacillus amyloliquefaciens group TaxID=1938374 RepID=UPI002E1BD89D|nr:hypothetical protein [Bacillus velezensis]
MSSLEKLVRIFIPIVVALCIFNILSAILDKKEFDNKAVVLNGEIIDKKVVEQTDFEPSLDIPMTTATGVPITTLKESSFPEYFLIVKFQNEKSSVSVTLNKFNNNEIGRKVKLKKYKDKITLVE